MGYRTDQFFGIQSAGESPYFRSSDSPYGSGYESGGDNPPFMYPARQVRTNDHSGYQTTQLRRGYMRSLRTQADGIEVDVKKCRFQFNPDILEQSVTQAEGLLNVFQSDPAQYSQPMPGNVSFGFTMMFDRTMEVNNSVSNNYYVPGVVGGPAIDPSNPWELSSPSEVGVLRDLAAMYAVIGQGISSSQKEYLAKIIERQAKLEFNDQVDPNAEGSVNEAAFNEIVDNQVPDFLGMNVGNTAFLLPVPVRIVFSSLYIVEGYVDSTSVVFTKFSTQMVPMQCSVTVNVNAKYIGFAKKDTFLTMTLEQEVKDREAAIQQDADTKNASSEAGALSIPSMSMGVVTHPNGSLDTPLTLQQWLTSGIGETSWTEAALAKPKPGVSQQPITNLFDKGQVSSVLVGGAVEVYGPFDSSVTNNTSQSGLNTYVATRGAAVLSTYRPLAGGKQSAATGAEWTRMAKDGARGPNGQSPSTYVDDTATKYYVVKYRAEVTLTGSVDTFSGTNTTKGTGFKYVVVPPGTAGSYLVKQDVTVVWPSYGTGADGSVIVGGASPLDPTPGQTSSVGASTRTTTTRPVVGVY